MAMTTKKFVIENIFGTFLLISFILQIIITFYIRRIELDHFLYLKKNWERQIYSHIHIKNESCAGSEINLMDRIQFPGTVEGGKNYFNQTIRMPNNETSFGINAIHAVNFNIQSFKGKYICLSFSKNPSNYFNLRRSTNESTKLGNVVGIDSTGNLLYDEGLNSVPFQNSKNNNNEYFPLPIDFVISENEPCINPEYGNNFSKLNKLDYYYGKNSCPDGKKFPKASVLFEEKEGDFVISKRELLEENKILDQLKKLPDYDTSSFDNITLKIYQVPYIGLHASILFNNDNKGDLDKYISNIQSLPSFNAILLISQLAFFLVYLVKFMVLITKYYRQKIKTPIYVKPTLMIIAVVNCIFVCIFFSKIINTPPVIEKIKDGKTIDENYYNIIKPTFSAVDSCLTFTWANLIINIVLGIKYGIRTAIKLAS